MIRLLNLLVFRSLRTHRVRTILSIIGIVLGVATILAIGMTNLMALDSVSRIFQNTSGRTSLMVVNAQQADKSVSTDLIQHINNIPGVMKAVPVIQMQTALVDERSSNALNMNFFGANVEGLTLYGIDPKQETALRDYHVIEGRFLDNDPKASEIVLVSDYATDKKYVLGDRVSIYTPLGIENLKLVGLIEKKGAGQINNGAFGVIPIALAQNLFERQDKADRIDIVAAPGYENVEALQGLKDTIQNRLGDAESVIYPSSQGKRMVQMLDNYQIGLNFMSGMALFVGAFLIYNAFSMNVIERKREFGMLRTIGMTSKQVIFLVLVEAFIIGLIGSTLGVGFGLAMALGLARLMEMMLGQTVVITQIPTDIVVTSVIVGMITSIVAALLPALQAGRISPLESLRIRGQSKPGWIIRYGWIPGSILVILAIVSLIWNPFPYDVHFRMGSLAVFALFAGAALLIPATLGIWERLAYPLLRLIYGSSGRLGSSNLQRQRLRTTLTIGALLIGVSMTMVTLGLTESFKVDLLDWINAYLGGDLFVSSKVQLPDGFTRRLETIEGVQSAAQVRYFDVKVHKTDGSEDPITFMAVDPADYTRVTNFVFSDSNTNTQDALNRLNGGNAVFVSTVIAERYGLKAGDILKLRTASGLKDFVVAATVVDFYNQGLVITGSWNDMRRNFKSPSASSVLVKLDSTQQTDETQTRIDDAYGKRYSLTIISNKVIKNSINNLMGQAFSMFDVLAEIAVIIAALGVVNTLTMSVTDRIKEIGMLRSIGMTRSQIAMMILAEAGMIGIIGGILGIAFGLILTRIFLTAMMTMSGYQLTYTMPADRVLLTLGIVLVITQLAAIFPAMRASRMAVLDAIHYE